MSSGATNWCILRTSGMGTLAVAQSLDAAGFPAWTPSEIRRRRVGRDRVMKETAHPITPGIVFAAYDRIPELIAFARKPALVYRQWNSEAKRMEVHGCPTFSVFRHAGRFPRIIDRHLDPLRQAEQRAQPRELAIVYSEGDAVRIPSAAFGGLSCTVMEVSGRHAVVCLSGPAGDMKIKVDMADILPAKTAA